MNWRGRTGESQGPVSHPGIMDQGPQGRWPFGCDTGRAIQMPISRAPEGHCSTGGGECYGKTKKAKSLCCDVPPVGRILFHSSSPSQEKQQQTDQPGESVGLTAEDAISQKIHKVAE